jgi:DeoR/GlpR family transcriptional regulator of sugar metabolism
MLAIDRQKNIMAELNAKGSITVSEMSKLLNVTEETIRRDLEKLESSNLLRRVHGGAYLLRGFEDEAPIDFRKNILTFEKKQIGDRACEEINHLDSIMLDSSTTALYIAKKLKAENKKVTVITNSLDTINELDGADNINLICIGGTLRLTSRSFTGYSTQKSLAQYHASKAFVSGSGIHQNFGITDHIDSEAQIRSLMLQNSNTRYIIADSSKFGRTAVNVVCNLDKIDCLITEKAPSSDWIKKLSELKIRLIVCNSDT